MSFARTASGTSPFDGDVAGDLGDFAVLGFTIGTVLRVDPFMRQAYGKAAGGNSLAFGIDTHRHRGTCAERGEKIIVRARPRIAATNRDRFISQQHVAAGSHMLLETAAARLADLDDALW